MKNHSLEEIEKQFQEQLRVTNPSKIKSNEFRVDLKYEFHESDMEEVFRQFDNKPLTRSSFIRPVKNDRNRKFGQIIY